MGPPGAPKLSQTRGRPEPKKSENPFSRRGEDSMELPSKKLAPIPLFSSSFSSSSQALEKTRLRPPLSKMVKVQPQDYMELVSLKKRQPPSFLKPRRKWTS